MSPNLAASITRSASKQTYYTIRFLADPERRDDAYRAYAYFRWVDDTLDSRLNSSPARDAFLQRQERLLRDCYDGCTWTDVIPQEEMLVELVHHNPQGGTGLHAYLQNMMAVMAFDAGRRGRLVSAARLDQYMRLLATAVTEAMHFFIGHDCSSPYDDTRYLAVCAAHITHMLRDSIEDARAGYFNIPKELLQSQHISPYDTESPAYRRWVKERVALARKYFRAGRDYLHRVGNLRCRLAGFAYAARFEWLLDTIEQEDYHLRASYDDLKRLHSDWQMYWLALSNSLGTGGRQYTSS